MTAPEDQGGTAMADLTFELRLEEPTIDLYRLDWSPAPDVRLAGMWVPGVVTDASRQDYLGLRGWGDYIPGMTHTVAPFCGFRALAKNLVDPPPHLFAEFSSHDWFEPFQYAETDDSVTFSHDTGRVVRDADGIHWYDADGRWELHGRTVSKPFVVHVPVQDGIPDQVYYRHELILASGTVNGVAVEGYLHQDYCYGEPGKTYMDLPILRQLEGMWVSWIHELEDGTIGGGCFWKGRSGVDFNPGYLLKDGETTTHGDISSDLTRNDDGQPNGLTVDIGGEHYEFVLDMVGGPMHYFGHLVSGTAAKPVARSWCWVEYIDGLISPEIVDLMSDRYRLARVRDN